MKPKTAIRGYADPQQQRLIVDDDARAIASFAPQCGVCEKELEWSEDIAQGLCQACHKETFGTPKFDDR